jgi:hypothetical protein
VSWAPAAGAAGTGWVACKVEVGATHIGGELESFPVWHLLVIYTNTSGEYYYRGGPGNPCVPTKPYKGIQGAFGLYVDRTVDYPAVHRTTAAQGPDVCGKDRCLETELRRIHHSCTPYQPFGPNSNTVARTLLSKCGLPQVRPVFLAPAWGDPDL